jgi:hypothetical protein
VRKTLCRCEPRARPDPSTEPSRLTAADRRGLTVIDETRRNLARIHTGTTGFDWQNVTVVDAG